MKLNSEWLLQPVTEQTPNRFTYENTAEQYAVDQILLNGHYLYACNTDFRECFLEAFGNELLLPGEDEVTFLYNNYFNLFYFGLLAAPYLIKQGSKPTFYLERCSAEYSIGLSQFLAEETQKQRRPVTAEPGMPFYYYKVSKTKFFKDSFSGEMKAICPATAMLTRAINFATLLNHDAQLVCNQLLENKDKDMQDFLDTLRDPSWSPFLYGK